MQRNSQKDFRSGIRESRPNIRAIIRYVHRYEGGWKAGERRKGIEKEEIGEKNAIPFTSLHYLIGWLPGKGTNVGVKASHCTGSVHKDLEQELRNHSRPTESLGFRG